MADISTILARKWPGMQWSMQDAEDYNTLTWTEGNASPKPTLEEIQAFNTEVDAALVTEARKAAQADAFDRAAVGRTLDALQVVTDALYELYRVINDIRGKLRGTAVTSTPVAWDAAVITQVQNMKTEIENVRANV